MVLLKLSLQCFVLIIGSCYVVLTDLVLKSLSVVQLSLVYCDVASRLDRCVQLSHV